MAGVSGDEFQAVVEGRVMGSGPVTAVVLTFNEEKHLERCLRSLGDLCVRVVVVDSFSTDATVQIATRWGATVYQREWPNNHADQLNFAIEIAQSQTPWMLRLDADEYLTPALLNELKKVLPQAAQDVGGFVLPRLVYFKDKPIRHGGFYPQWLLRVWRTKKGSCEVRNMDEHMVLTEGRVESLKSDLIDRNTNDIFWWTQKHNAYARREAADLVNLRHHLSLSDVRLQGSPVSHASSKRWIKEKIYARLPIVLRALAYFIYRFFFRLAFLDHPRVWVFHFLQAAWYRTLVDVNVMEFEDAVGAASPEEQRKFLSERWSIKID